MLTRSSRSSTAHSVRYIANLKSSLTPACSMKRARNRRNSACWSAADCERSARASRSGSRAASSGDDITMLVSSIPPRVSERFTAPTHPARASSSASLIRSSSLELNPEYLLSFVAMLTRSPAQVAAKAMVSGKSAGEIESTISMSTPGLPK